MRKHEAGGCEAHMLIAALQRQTVVSQFYQINKLVVEGGKSVWSKRSTIEEGANGS
jgi:hypothetical protein